MYHQRFLSTFVIRSFLEFSRAIIWIRQIYKLLPTVKIVLLTGSRFNSSFSLVRHRPRLKGSLLSRGFEQMRIPPHRSRINPIVSTLLPFSKHRYFFFLLSYVGPGPIRSIFVDSFFRSEEIYPLTLELNGFAPGLLRVRR